MASRFSHRVISSMWGGRIEETAVWVMAVAFSLCRIIDSVTVGEVILVVGDDVHYCIFPATRGLRTAVYRPGTLHSRVELVYVVRNLVLALEW